MKTHSVGIRVLSVIVLLVGAGLIVVGIQRSGTTHEVVLSVERYFDALVRGDRADLLAELSPEAQEAWLDHRANRPGFLPRPMLKCKIKSVTVDSSDAIVKTELSQGLYRIEPLIGYERQPDGRWQIVSVRNLAPDPAWECAVREVQRRSDESLARELKMRLNEPGATVVR